MKTPDKNPETIKEMFNSISKDYDKLNDIISLGLHKKIKNDAIKISLSPNAKILDLCTGTGDLAGLLKNKYPESEVIGVDFSQNMLKIAKEKYHNVNFIEADCTQLPFQDESFDLCVISFGLRNIENLQKALEEINRILKPGGIFINIDLGKPQKPFKSVMKIYMYIWVAILGKIFHGDETPYKYLAESNENFPSQGELLEIYKKIGFKNCKNKNYALGQIARQICCK